MITYLLSTICEISLNITTLNSSSSKKGHSSSGPKEPHSDLNLESSELMQSSSIYPKSEAERIGSSEICSC